METQKSTAKRSGSEGPSTLPPQPTVRHSGEKQGSDGACGSATLAEESPRPIAQATGSKKDKEPLSKK